MRWYEITPWLALWRYRRVVVAVGWWIMVVAFVVGYASVMLGLAGLI